MLASCIDPDIRHVHRVLALSWVFVDSCAVTPAKTPDFTCFDQILVYFPGILSGFQNEALCICKRESDQHGYRLLAGSIGQRRPGSEWACIVPELRRKLHATCINAVFGEKHSYFGHLGVEMGQQSSREWENRLNRVFAHLKIERFHNYGIPNTKLSSSVWNIVRIPVSAGLRKQ